MICCVNKCPITKNLRNSARKESGIHIVNSPLMEALVSRQLYLPILFSIPLLFSKENFVFTHFRKQTLSTVPDNFRGENWIFFCLCSLVSGHPMHNSGLLAEKFVFNLQINKNLTFDRATIQ